MTLIAYKDGVICADTQCANGLGFSNPDPAIKIGRFESSGAIPRLFGVAGSASVGRLWINYLLSGEVGERPWRETGADFDPVFCVDADERFRYWASTAEPEEMGISRGRGFAIGFSAYLEGMMHAGMDAISAVRAMIDDGYRAASYPLTVLGMKGGAAVIFRDFAIGNPAGADLMAPLRHLDAKYQIVDNGPEDPNAFLTHALASGKPPT